MAESFSVSPYFEPRVLQDCDLSTTLEESDLLRGEGGHRVRHGAKREGRIGPFRAAEMRADAHPGTGIDETLQGRQSGLDPEVITDCTFLHGDIQV